MANFFFVIQDGSIVGINFWPFLTLYSAITLIVVAAIESSTREYDIEDFVAVWGIVIFILCPAAGALLAGMTALIASPGARPYAIMIYGGIILATLVNRLRG